MISDFSLLTLKLHLIIALIFYKSNGWPHGDGKCMNRNSMKITAIFQRVRTECLQNANTKIKCKPLEHGIFVEMEMVITVFYTSSSNVN